MMMIMMMRRNKVDVNDVNDVNVSYDLLLLGGRLLFTGELPVFTDNFFTVFHRVLRNKIRPS